MSWVAVGVAVVGAVGTGIKAYGDYKSAQSGASVSRYKAGMALVNQKLALQNADYSRKMGEVQAQESGMRSRFQQGKIKVAQGASGIDVNSGSSADVRSSQLMIGQMDEGVIRANAARRAYGYEVEAAKDESESAMDLRAAGDITSAGKITAGTSILGGAASVASKWSTASQYGLYGSDGKTQAEMGGGYGGDSYEA